MEHVGSAHDEQELEALEAAAAQRLASLYPQLDLDLDGPDSSSGGERAPANATLTRSGTTGAHVSMSVFCQQTSTTSSAPESAS